MKGRKFIPFEYDGWSMGKYGVCTRLENDAFLPSFQTVKLADLRTTDLVREKAIEAGYTRVWDGRDYRYSAPPKG